VEQWRRGVRVGEALAEARGRAGLTVAEVSRRTRIREPVVRGIEGDDYSACGGDFYARGNIRSIAKAVGADPEPLICEYDAVHRAPGVLSAVSLDELLTRGQGTGRRRRGWTVVLGLALIAALGFVGYRFLAGSPDAASSPPAAANHAVAANHAAAANHAVTNAGRSRAILTEPRRPAPSRHSLAPVWKPMRPTDTVRAYITAINGQHYARAWRLGGRNVSGSYSGFVAGFAGTARDTLTILSVSGDVVTARLGARQTDGTVDTYQGTYTVHHGVIIGADVVQVS
jgi:helix-turn-helix protein